MLNSTPDKPETTDADETKLVTRYQTGDQEAFGTLMERYGRQLLAFLSSRCSHGLSPDDVAQHVWMMAWKNRSQFEPGNFRAWLYTIARNHIHSYFRKERTVAWSEEFDLAAPELDPIDPRIEFLRDCLQSLEGAMIDAIRLQLQGATTKEIARQLVIEEGTVGSRVVRAKQRLKDCVTRKMQ